MITLRDLQLAKRAVSPKNECRYHNANAATCEQCAILAERYRERQYVAERKAAHQVWLSEQAA